MKKIIYTSVILIGLLVVYSITYRSTNVESISAILPLTGPVASFGEQAKTALLSKGITSIEDDGCDPKLALSALTKLRDSTYIVGPICGSPQEVVAPRVLPTQILLLPSAASSDLSNENIYNVQYSLEKEASYIAEQVRNRHKGAIGIITYGNGFSEKSSNSFIDVMNKTGKVYTQFKINDTQSSVANTVLSIKNGDFDALYVSDISFFLQGGLKKMRDLKIEIPVYAQYPAQMPEIRNLVDGVIYSYPSDLTDDASATYQLTIRAAQLAIDVKKMCGKDIECAKDILNNKFGYSEGELKNARIELRRIEGKKSISY